MMFNGDYLTSKDVELFFNEVKYENRTFLSDSSIRFLNRLEDLCKRHEVTLSTNDRLYRARRGFAFDKKVTKKEFYPLPRNASEGRANPSYINVLYAADHPDIAVAEVRAITGEKILLATLELKKELKIIDFSAERPGMDNYLMIGHNGTPEEQKAFHERDCLLKIGGIFSNPLTVDDSRREYIPTQIIAEYIKNRGYDGIAYQSQFSLQGEPRLNKNYAFFDVNVVDPVMFQHRTVSKIIFETSHFSEQISL